MASSHPGSARQQWCFGRGFASMDPVRQGEVVGFVRSGPIETTPAQRTPAAVTRSSRLDWLRVQPDREGANFEGSSSRRSR